MAKTSVHPMPPKNLIVYPDGNNNDWHCMPIDGEFASRKSRERSGT